MRKHLSAALLSANCLLAAAQAGEARLTLPDPSGYQTLRVPLALRMQARSAELNDLRLRNGRGETLPFAWLPIPAPEPQAQRRWQAAPLFKAPAAVAPATSAAAARQDDWLIDLRKLPGTLTELELSLPPEAQGVWRFALEHSPDLQRWQLLSAEAQLVQLRQAGQVLAHTRFELGAWRGGYLRLRPLKGQATPPLAAARVQSQQQHRTAPPIEWTEPIAPSHCNASHCDYELPRHLPVDRLAWQLDAVNTLAPVTVYGQAPAAPFAAPPPQRHGLRAHLRQLRNKSAPQTSAPAAEEPWQWLTQSSLYWLRLPGGEARAPDTQLDGRLFERLRLQPEGGMAALGSQPPKLRLGTRAALLVFLAREPAPFKLSWGDIDAPAALALSQLMPTRQAGDPLPPETVQVHMPAPPPAALPASAPAPAKPAATPATPAAPDPGPRYGLWAALLAALAVMGAMAYSLLRGSPKAAE